MGRGRLGLGQPGGRAGGQEQALVGHLLKLTPHVRVAEQPTLQLQQRLVKGGQQLLVG